MSSPSRPRLDAACRILGIFVLAALAFIAGCTTAGTKEPTIGPAAKLAVMVQPSSVSAGSSISPGVSVSIEDAAGNVVTSATNQITIAIGANPSAGTLAGTATAAAVNGVATFSNLSINNPGTAYTLTAGASGLTSATSNSFNVVGAAAKLAFTVQPSAVVAGTSITPAVSVSIEDATGNVVTSATNQITVAIGTNPSGGTLAGTSVANAVNGVATFSTLNISKVGTGYTLAASATGLTASSSSAFNVTAGAPAKLAFTVQPSNTTAGVAIGPAVQVTVQDAQGNTVTTATNTITMGSGTGTGALIGTTAANAVNGVATFSNLEINVAGTGDTLTASSAGLTGATSSPFNITVGAASKLVFIQQLTSVAAGSSINPAVSVNIEDAAGNLVTTATNQITIAIGTNPSTGTLSGTSVANAVNGVATFSNLSINNAGTGYTLTANATGLTAATTNAFNVTAGAATKLVFTQQPGNVAAGSSITSTVSIEDAQGNVVTTATNQITIAIGTNPSSGTLSGTAVANAVNGVATFSSLSINNAGTGYTLTASATGLTSATSAAFNVTVGAATKLVFTTQPSSATAGSSITPSVVASIEDAQGNVVTTATNQITVAIGTNPSAGTLSGTAVANAVNGVAIFSNLSINKEGTAYMLTANATGLTASTSAAFNITAGAATKLVFSQQPSNVAAGSSITPAVSVSIEDSLGNIVTTATNNVTAIIGTNPASGTLTGTATVQAVSGVATFSNLSINNAGTAYTLTTNATGLTGATSTAFNVTVGAASKLVFMTQPSSVTAGSSITPAVTASIEDAQGNVVTTATNQITIAIGTNPSSGTLSGTAVANAVNGVATFSNLSINSAGTGYTLTANATGLAAAASTAFNVTAGAATKLVFTQQPTSVIPGSSIAPAVAVSVEDSQGNVVTTATNQITIAIGTNPSSGTLSGTAVANAVNGVATFSNLSINNAGVGYTLTAGAAGFTTIISNAFNNVALGVPAKLAFTVQPGNATAGGSISLSVSVEDAIGNLVNTATNQITLAIGTNPSSGTLSGTAVANAVNGVATFSNLSINNAGTAYTLTASATGFTATTSTAFNITAGTATKLVFTTEPSNVVAGISISPAVVVSVEDALGNVVASATNQITIGIGINPVSGTLSGTAVANAVNGVATFSNLSINKSAPGYSLGASATGLTSVSSTTFNVTAGTATKLVFTTEPSTVGAGNSIATTVSIEDALGNVVTTATNQITIAIGTNPSSGTLSGTAIANAVNGVAAYSNLSINDAGTGYTLTANATGVTAATSTAFNITAGTATKLVFTQQPSNVVAGSSIAPALTVSIEDTLGNVVTSATNSVSMAIGTNPSSGTLSGTLAVNAVNGVATFSNLSVNKAGTAYTLTASVNIPLSVTSNAFNVTSGGATNLVFTTQPTTAAAGSSIAPSVTVSIEDSLGNVVTAATNQITIAIGTNPSTGTLSGAAIANAVNGVATFSNLSINNAGTGYTLTATATGLTAATSTTFNITAGTATKLVFTQQPSNVAAGSSISPAATVSIEDTLGNVVTTATNQITIAIGTNPASGTLSGTLSVNAVNGVATFSTLDINNLGNGYTLTASATGFTTVTSTTFNVSTACSTNCTISGTVTGAWVSGVTISISGGSPTTTDVNGNYSFTGLAGGTYTVTPSLAGYTYTPAAPQVATSAGTTTQNFVATSALTSYSISGTINYAGSKTGNTIIRVYPGGCTNCSVVAGTSISAAPSSTGTSYTVRGLAPVNGGENGNGTYAVSAEIDTLGTGITNESNPEGTSSTVTLTSSNATGVNFTVIDRTPSSPVTPSQSQFSVFPGNNSALVQYKDIQDNNGEEIATSYKVYYDTNSNFTNNTFSTFKAQGQGSNVFILKGIPNGLTYFKLSAVNSLGESAATTPVSVTLGTATGLNTVSGTVTFPGTPTGTLYVGVYNSNGNGIYSQAIVNPVSPQSYSVSGVPAGTYQNFAIFDTNNDGEIDAGDIDNVNNHGNPPTLTLSGSSGTTTGNITLTNPVSTTGVPTTTNQSTGGGTISYNISVELSSGSKLPISVTLFSGKSVAVPFDMNADQHNANYNPIYNSSVSPSVGDIYQFLVTFSDGTKQVVTGTVNAVLTSFAQNLQMNSPVANTATIPVLNWSAPALPPAVFNYQVNLYSTNGSPSENWNYSGNNNGIPSTQTNVLFNADGSASSPSLTVGATYNWSVQIQDDNDNSATITTTYTVP